MGECSWRGGGNYGNVKTFLVSDFGLHVSRRGQLVSFSTKAFIGCFIAIGSMNF